MRCIKSVIDSFANNSGIGVLTYDDIFRQLITICFFMWWIYAAIFYKYIPCVAPLGFVGSRFNRQDFSKPFPMLCIFICLNRLGRDINRWVIVYRIRTEKCITANRWWFYSITNDCIKTKTICKSPISNLFQACG